MEAKFIVSAFVDAINTRDVEALAQLMLTPCLADNQYAPVFPDYRIPTLSKGLKSKAVLGKP